MPGLHPCRAVSLQSLAILNVQIVMSDPFMRDYSRALAEALREKDLNRTTGAGGPSDVDKIRSCYIDLWYLRYRGACAGKKATKWTGKERRRRTEMGALL